MKDLMERLPHKVPAVAWVYGVLGLIPFIGCAAADIAGLAPNQDWWRLALLIYGAIILSFLGGARWGLELARVQASATAITLSMAPSLAGFFLLLAPPHLRRWAPAARRLRTLCSGSGIFERTPHPKATAASDQCSPPAPFYPSRSQ
jgi:drug/metabolite transporter (DMT)-like permease